MIPRLRKQNGLWLCELSGWITGIHYTPLQAYDDWLAVNLGLLVA